MTTTKCMGQSALVDHAATAIFPGNLKKITVLKEKS